VKIGTVRVSDVLVALIRRCGYGGEGARDEASRVLENCGGPDQEQRLIGWLTHVLKDPKVGSAIAVATSRTQKRDDPPRARAEVRYNDLSREALNA
jgi:hypothetical protein